MTVADWEDPAGAGVTYTAPGLALRIDRAARAVATA
jgi:hypothetical protein